MSYQIIFKGQVGDEFVEDYVGRQLADDFKNNTMSERVDINGNIYDSRSIKAVRSGFQNPDKSDKNEQNLKMIREMWEENRIEKEKLMKLSPTDRARSGANLGLAGVMFMAFKGRRMNEEEEARVIENSAKWFEAHPDFDIANPSCYLDKSGLFLERNPALSSKDAYKIGALNFAERVLNS